MSAMLRERCPNRAPYDPCRLSVSGLGRAAGWGGWAVSRCQDARFPVASILGAEQGQCR
jgi:hypothetical protein